MNERNVKALAALIREVDGAHELGAGALAELLASRGVLVPSALTDDEAYELGCTSDFTVGRERDLPRTAPAVRAELERIARGAE